MNVTLDPQTFLEFPHETSSILFAAFTGLQLKAKVPDFHWLGALKPYPVNVLAVRDMRQMMYQCGVPGVGDSAASLGRWLRDYAAERGMKASLSLGGSIGGYAALLYGWFLGSDVVHSFAPLTRLPTRTPLQLLPLLAKGHWGLVRVNYRLLFDRRLDHGCYDLKEVLSQDNGRSTYHIYYGTSHARDTIHAERLAGLPGVVLHPVDTHEHHVSTLMRDSGELAEILADSHRLLEGLAAER